MITLRELIHKVKTMKNSKRFLLIVFNRFIKTIVILFCIRMAVTGVAVLQPILLSSIINILIDGLYDEVSLYICFFAAAETVRIVLSFCVRKLDVAFSRNGSLFVKNLIQKDLMYTPSKYHDFNYGYMESLLTSDSSAPTAMITFGMSLLLDFIAAIIICVVCFKINVMLTTIILLQYPITFVITRYYTKRLKDMSHEFIECNDKYLSAIRSVISNILNIFVDQCEEQVSRILYSSANKGTEASRNLGKLQANYNLASMIISSISSFCVIMYSVLSIQSGAMLIGNLILFLSYSTRLSRGFESLISAPTTIQTVLVSLKRLADRHFLSQRAIDDEQSRKVFCERVTSIEVVNGTYYVDGNCVFSKLSFKARVGEIIGITGANGVGKTTLANILSLKRKLSEGEVLINGENIENYSFYDLVKRISYVDSKTPLYQMSIKDNLHPSPLGNSDIIDFLSHIMGLNFDVNDYKRIDDGFNVSTGQQQKIKMIRALAQEPDLIILDEAFSSLDNKSKMEMQRFLREISSDKVIIIISHIEEELHFCDRIVEFNSLISDSYWK